MVMIRAVLVALIEKFHLCDVWMDDGVTSKGNHFTWNDNTTESRLDYFFVSKLSTIDEISIMTIISDTIGKRLTDHKAILLNCHTKTPKRGPGYWKLSAKLLENAAYCKGVVNIIRSVENDNKLINCSESTNWDYMKMKMLCKSS